MIRRTLLPALAALLLAVPAAAQDVEMLGRVHGTRPPPAYRELRDRDPRAFEFRRAWMARAGIGVGEDRRLAPLRYQDAGSASAAGPARAPVRGTFAVPLVLGLFSDSPALPPFSRQRVAQQFFVGPNPTGTITQYYDEISRGRVALEGETLPWVRTSLTGAQVTGGVSGLGGSSRVGQFIVEILVAHQGSVDWGRFDNDGPDGRPNSGDDDGYVDVLTVMHPTEGAECDASYDRIWSHRWSLTGALGNGQAFRTTTPAAGGGVIRIDDYTIQPVYDCDRAAINEIGVFAHELGHGFGLPDLYATGGSAHFGVGRWGLMGSGAWGCGSFEPARPCHMSAWSKALLGWVDVEVLPPGTDLGTLSLDPVETSGRVLMVEAGDGSAEHFLLENRQRSGFDGSLPAPGLLVWHIDPAEVGRRLSFNAVNADPRHMGVWLRQADGRDQLGLPGEEGGNGGDTGDPFPGASAATAFHAGSSPASISHRGGATGLTLLDIALDGQRVRFRALTRYQAIRLEGAGAAASFVVDGVTLEPGDRTVPTAPFQTRVVTAPGGAEVSPGVRRTFSSWRDGGAAGPRRTFTAGLTDATLSAVFDGATEYRLLLAVKGDTAGISPGAVVVNPASGDGWYAPGTEVSLHAQPRPGFAFLGWGGDLAGNPNPALVSLAAPVSAAALFEQVFAVAEAPVVSFPAATAREIVLQAADGTPPYRWILREGRMPVGMELSPDGRIHGAAFESGSFPLMVQAVDGIGLLARASLTLEVSVPVLGVIALTDDFFLRPATLTGFQRTYLDRAGNRNGVYDLGDFRAYVLANPALPMTSAEQGVVRTLVPLLRFKPEGGP